MELFQPVNGIGQQKVVYLAPTVIEYQRSPVLMFTAPRVCMFISGFSSETGEGIVILWKVRRHPVEKDTNTFLMTGIDEVTEVIGRAMARSRRKISRYLVTPGFIQGMFTDRQQFDMRIAQFLDPGDQFLGQLPPLIKTAIFMTSP